MITAVISLGGEDRLVEEDMTKKEEERDSEKEDTIKTRDASVKRY